MAFLSRNCCASVNETVVIYETIAIPLVFLQPVNTLDRAQKQSLRVIEQNTAKLVIIDPSKSKTLRSVEPLHTRIKDDEVSPLPHDLENDNVQDFYLFSQQR